jgi:hypothetical protein
MSSSRHGQRPSIGRVRAAFDRGGPAVVNIEGTKAYPETDDLWRVRRVCEWSITAHLRPGSD